MTSAASPPANARLAFHIDDVECQHLRLEQLLRDLTDALRRSIPTQEAVCSAFGRLNEYARIHFADEEQFMAQNGFPAADLERHRRAHEIFLDKLTFAHRQLCSSGTLPPTAEIESLVLHWFEAHRAHEDQAYIDYFERRDG